MTRTGKLFSIDEFQIILDAGVFLPDTFVELIPGEIIEMADPAGPYIGRVNKLNRLFTSALGETVIVSEQNAVRIRQISPMSRPRPDVALLKPLPELFGPFEPTPDDGLLLIEISGTTTTTEKPRRRFTLKPESRNTGHPRKRFGSEDRSG